VGFSGETVAAMGMAVPLGTHEEVRHQARTLWQNRLEEPQTLGQQSVRLIN